MINGIADRTRVFWDRINFEERRKKKRENFERNFNAPDEEL